ncbi:MAG TPA: carboxypeptidase regulatory-like domain-containing protein [Vicinamibacterales bacterium]|nr:carboxypeptidase regulatory-like domain-containing protein [Vicinamibacterales bacterium]
MSAFAQETINSASVSGRVLDPQGAVVPGALVVAKQTQTNIQTESVTDGEGRFRFPYLRVGPYEITVHLQGFSAPTRTLTLTAGSAYDISVALTVGALEASVTVTGDATLLEAARSQIAATVPEEEVRTLPMNGRQFLDIALLVPGVSPTNTASTQLFAETSAVPGQGLSIGSQRNFSNNFIVDGLSANDDAAGLSGMPIAVDAIDQFQVVTSGGQAELGRALGGYVNVVTKSGTNELHGDGYGYFRDDRLNAANPLTGATLPMNQKQYGASIGGPLEPNRTFYFVNAENRRLNQSGLTTISDASVAAINARLAAVRYPGAPIATGVYPNPVDTINVLGRIDHRAGASDQLTMRYAEYGATSTNSRNAGGLNATSASASLDDTDRALSMSNVWTLSSRTVNETRAQFVYSNLLAPPADSIGPAVSIAGVATFGTLSVAPTGRLNKLYEVVDNVSHQAGAHALRAGADVLFNDDTIAFPRSIRGSYSFSSLANFLSGLYNNAGFTQTFGAAVVSQTNPNVGVYAQDEWKAAPGLTINAGVRYDLQWLPTIATDTDNLAPRAGFAWTPTASRRTIVRGSAGIFYDRVPLRAVANALLSANNTADIANLQQTNVSLTPGQAGSPAFPSILAAAVPSVTLPNLTTMDPRMKNAYSRQAAFEIERQLGERTTLSAGYQYTRGVDLLIQINRNVPSCVAAGTNNGCRPVAAYGNNNQYSPSAASAYHGFHVSLVGRPRAWGSYRVSYTLSKAMDNVGEFFFSSPIDPFDINRDWGRSDDDQRHRLVMDGTLRIHGFEIGGVLQYYSPLPLNVTSGVTTVQGTAGRPIVDGAFIDRNAGDGPDFFSLNARVSRTFRVHRRARLELIAEAFNLTNRTNVVALNGNFGAGAYPSAPSPAFGQVTAVGDPRSLQLGARVGF